MSSFQSYGLLNVSFTNGLEVFVFCASWPMKLFYRKGSVLNT